MLSKEIVVPASASFLKRATLTLIPPAFTLKLVSSVLHVSGAFWAAALVLVPRASELWVNKFMHELFKRNAWDSRRTSSHLKEIPADFHNHVLWVLIFLALVCCTGELGVGLGPLSSQGRPLQLRYPSEFLNTTPWVWDLPVLHLHSFY